MYGWTNLSYLFRIKLYKYIGFYILMCTKFHQAYKMYIINLFNVFIQI